MKFCGPSIQKRNIKTKTKIFVLPIRPDQIGRSAAAIT